jgi:hypothetical protein
MKKISKIWASTKNTGYPKGRVFSKRRRPKTAILGITSVYESLMLL